MLEKFICLQSPSGPSALTLSSGYEKEYEAWQDISIERDT